MVGGRRAPERVNELPERTLLARDKVRVAARCERRRRRSNRVSEQRSGVCELKGRALRASQHANHANAKTNDGRRRNLAEDDDASRLLYATARIDARMFAGQSRSSNCNATTDRKAHVTFVACVCVSVHERVVDQYTLSTLPVDRNRQAT